MHIEERPGACMIVYNPETNCVYMGQRSDTKKWCFAGGKQEECDQGDTYNTALRELREEFGFVFDEDVKSYSLGSCIVPGFKRFKHDNAKDTFESTFYKTAVYLAVTQKEFHHIAIDGEMDKVVKINLDDIFMQLGDELSPSTMIVANIATSYINNFFKKKGSK